MQALSPSSHPLCMVALRALMDDMWLSPARHEVVSPATHVRSLLGLDPDTWRGLVGDLIEAGLLVREVRDLGEIVWQSPALKDAAAAHESRDRQARRMSDRRKSKEQAESMRLSLRRRVGGQAPHKATRVLYLETDDLASVSDEAFPGWLPTNLFDGSGQAVGLDREDQRALARRYPATDVPRELDRAYRYLRVRPGARPSSSGMASFVDRWMAGEYQTRATESIDSVIDQLDSLPDFEETL